MTAAAFVERLDNVRSRGAGKWSARCPAHADKSPSLSITDATGRILVHCFGGCEPAEVLTALGLKLSDLFTDAPDPHTACRDRLRRTHERHRQFLRDEVAGFAVDALREAECFVQSRQGLNIAGWSNERLNDELDALADAHALLFAEEVQRWT